MYNEYVARVGVLLTNEEKEFVARRSKRLGISRAEFFRGLLREYRMRDKEVAEPSQDTDEEVAKLCEGVL